MKKLLIITALLFGQILSYGLAFNTDTTSALKIDTVIITDCYTSYFNNSLHVPIFVTYKLYKGGGDCSRAKDRFKYVNGINSATNKDYVGNGFDIGHLADSKDFAYNCQLQEQTFRFYNALPQTPELNRGIWKTLEYNTRKASQDDSLFIICGGIFDSCEFIGNNIAVPKYCWKIAYNMATNEMLYCYLFTNDSTPIKYIVDVQYIEQRIKNVLPKINNDATEFNR